MTRHYIVMLKGNNPSEFSIEASYYIVTEFGVLEFRNVSNVTVASVSSHEWTYVFLSANNEEIDKMMARMNNDAQ